MAYCNHRTAGLHILTSWLLSVGAIGKHLGTGKGFRALLFCACQVCTAAGLLAVGHQQGDVRLFQFSSSSHDVCQVSVRR